MRLSFIIPYYNGKMYINQCVGSLFMQDVDRDDYEVIIVDDCSSDIESVVVLSELKSHFHNLRVIHNEINQRCGICRNIGVKEAKGDYIWFVDQDDYVESNCLRKLLEICENNRLDLLTFDYQNVNDSLSHNDKRHLIQQQTRVLTGIEYAKQVLNYDFWNNEYDTNVWHSLFRREFLLKNEIFSPPVSYCEDLIVAQKAIIMAEKMMTISDSCYNYRYNENSVYHTQVGVQGRPLFDSTIWTGTELIKIADNCHDSYARCVICKGGVSRINAFTKAVLKYTSSQRKIFFEQVSFHQDVVKFAAKYMNKTNAFIIHHPNFVNRFRGLFYFLVKIRVL